MSHVHDREAKLVSRKGPDLSHEYPALTQELNRQSRRYLIFDGVIVARHDDGRRAFQRLQARIKRNGNAQAEAFIKTLKREEVYLKKYASFADAERNLGRFIKGVYNAKRLHPSLA